MRRSSCLRCCCCSKTTAVVDAYKGADERRAVGGACSSCKSLLVGSFVPPPTADTNSVGHGSILPSLQVAPPDRSGYPGQLSPSQQQSYREFKTRILQDPDNTFQNMIRCFSTVEDEEHAICRYLRARKFNVDATLQMMRDRSDLWREGAAHSFYPEFRDALGGESSCTIVPESVFLSQLKLVLGKNNKYNCPILYFSAGRVRADGLQVLASFDNIPKYVWHLVVHKLPRHIARLQEDNNAKTIPIELLVIADLKDISLNSLRRTLKALEDAMRVLNVFPEVLSHVVMVNVPRYFMPFWPIIRSFVDKDTAEKFELFASEERGRHRLLQLVESIHLASDYGGSGPSTDRLMLEHCEISAHQIRTRHVELLYCRRGVATIAEGSVNVQSEEEFVSIRIYTGEGGSQSTRIYFRLESSKYKARRIQLSRDSRVFYAQAAGPSLGNTTYDIEVQRGKDGGFIEHYLLVTDVRK